MSEVIDLDLRTLRRIVRQTTPASVVGVYARMALAAEEGRGVRFTAEQVWEVYVGDCAIQQALWTYLEEDDDAY